MWYMIFEHWYVLLIALIVGIALGWWLCRPESA